MINDINSKKNSKIKICSDLTKSQQTNVGFFLDYLSGF